MPRLPTTPALLLLAILPLAARGPSPAAAQDRPSTRPSAADEWVDDARLRTSMIDGATALTEADRAPARAELIKGLEQRTCDLELPREPAQAIDAAEHASAARLDSQALYERALDAVAAVGSAYKCTRCTNWHVNAATGFFLTPGGALVTNYHVVNQPEHPALLVMTQDGRVFPVTKTLAADADADIAIVQVEPIDQHGRPASFATLPLAGRSRVGQNVRVIHHADGRYYTLTEGIVSRRYIDEKHGGARWMTITAEYARGSSGGPLFDDAGRVIGIVSSTNSVYYNQNEAGQPQNMQMVWRQCVPVENIRALLGEE